MLCVYIISFPLYGLGNRSIETLKVMGVIKKGEKLFIFFCDHEATHSPNTTNQLIAFEVLDVLGFGVHPATKATILVTSLKPPIYYP